MATTTFTISNGNTISVEESGNVWQGHVLVPAADVEVGDAISVGCGFPVIAVTEKETE